MMASKVSKETQLQRMSMVVILVLSGIMFYPGSLRHIPTSCAGAEVLYNTSPIGPALALDPRCGVSSSSLPLSPSSSMAS